VNWFGTHCPNLQRYQLGTLKSEKIQVATNLELNWKRESKLGEH